MKGYKVFCADWQCRNYQYKVGETFEEDVTPSCCKRGFHFCVDLKDCFNYYSFNPKNKVAEIEALGEIDASIDKSKYCTNKIKIVREITWEEVLRLVNEGVGCTGLGNIGDFNSGNGNEGRYNSGYDNIGDYNSGNSNEGFGNTGAFNKGECNSGNHNIGDFNSGSWNNGSWNSGSCNVGEYNSGDCNRGGCNNGHHNIGYFNSGNWNKGSYNCGSENNGSENSGNHNIGNYNTGDWNKTSYSNGCFNTVKEPKIMMFNKPSNWTMGDWRNSQARMLLNRIIPEITVEWISELHMTKEAVEQYPEYEIAGGCLEERTESKINNGQIWWDRLNEDEKKIIFDLPNFDADIFEEITGIRV